MRARWLARTLVSVNKVQEEPGKRFTELQLFYLVRSQRETKTAFGVDFGQEVEQLLYNNIHDDDDYKTS